MRKKTLIATAFATLLFPLSVSLTTVHADSPAWNSDVYKKVKKTELDKTPFTKLIRLNSKQVEKNGHTYQYAYTEYSPFEMTFKDYYYLVASDLSKIDDAPLEYSEFVDKNGETLKEQPKYKGLSKKALERLKNN